jgi:hypothetical protein
MDTVKQRTPVGIPVDRRLIFGIRNHESNAKPSSINFLFSAPSVQNFLNTSGVKLVSKYTSYASASSAYQHSASSLSTKAQ